MEIMQDQHGKAEGKSVLPTPARRFLFGPQTVSTKRLRWTSSPQSAITPLARRRAAGHRGYKSISRKKLSGWKYTFPLIFGYHFPQRGPRNPMARPQYGRHLPAPPPIAPLWHRKCRRQDVQNWVTKPRLPSAGSLPTRPPTAPFMMSRSSPPLPMTIANG